MQTPLANLQLLPIFHGVSSEALAVLAQCCTVCSHSRGDAIVTAGAPAESVYIVLYGSVKLVRAHPSGKNRIIHLLIRGELLGAAVAMQRGRYPVDAVALESTTLLRIPCQNFAQDFLSHPQCGTALMAQLTTRLDVAHSEQTLAYDSVEARLASYLCTLLSRVQDQFGQTTQIPIPLTRQDLADCVGSTVETVIRIVRHWSTNGVVAVHDRCIDIPNVSRLQQVAAGRA